MLKNVWFWKHGIWIFSKKLVSCTPSWTNTIPKTNILLTLQPQRYPYLSHKLKTSFSKCIIWWNFTSFSPFHANRWQSALARRNASFRRFLRFKLGLHCENQLVGHVSRNFDEIWCILSKSDPIIKIQFLEVENVITPNEVKQCCIMPHTMNSRLIPG